MCPCRIGIFGGIGLPPETVVVVVIVIVVVVVIVVVGVVVVVVVNTNKCILQDWDMWWNWFATGNCRCHRGGRRWKTSSIP